MSIIKAKEKSNKIHENIIGKIIYGFLLFAPLLMILTTSCYAIFNKNAHESYYGETINESQVINTYELKSNIKYTYSYTSTQMQNPIIDARFNITDFKFVSSSSTTIADSLIAIQDSIIQVYFWNNEPNNIKQSITFVYSNNDTTTSNYLVSLYNSQGSFAYITFSFIPLSDYEISNQNASENFSYIQYNKYSYLDNNFDYGIYKTEQSQYFNWSKSTALYTGLRATCQSLGIDNTFTPMLMAYWLLISIIYFIFDIGLIMVHLVHRKIHEFTESV